MDRPKLILLVGIPGSGKTTYAKNYIKSYLHTIHLSSDSIRAELYNDESIQGDPAEVFSLMQKRAIEALNNGQNVVYDATNITRKDRASIIGICPKFAKIEAHIVWQPIEVCIERDASRERTVGKRIIDRMLKRFQAPYYDEGIDEIKIIKPEIWNKSEYEDACFKAMNIPHDNPHHTLGVMDHCSEARRYLYNAKSCYDSDLLLAASIHDVGKPYVKAFINSKGEPCEIAHYYQHQCVGAWVSYGFNFVTPRVAWLVSSHMEPFLNTKYYKNLPSFLKKDIDLLHEADLEAH